MGFCDERRGVRTTRSGLDFMMKVGGGAEVTGNKTHVGVGDALAAKELTIKQVKKFAIKPLKRLTIKPL